MTASSPSNAPVIDNPASNEALTLMLYSPAPGYALVCFDDASTKKDQPPKSFQEVANDLGDKRNNADMKFLLCHTDQVDMTHFDNPSSTTETSTSRAAEEDNNAKPPQFPTYILFRCGSDFKELARMSPGSRDSDHTDKLRSFAICSKQIDPSDTLTQQILKKRAIARVNGFLDYLGKKHNVKLTLDSKGKGSVKLGDYDCLFLTGKGTCKIVAYIGKEKHNNNADLMQEVLCWNFGADFLSGFMIGIERGSGRFTLETDMFILEERYNEVTFENVTSNFSSTIKKCVEKIQDFVKKKEEKAKKAKPPEPSLKQLREKRLNKLIEEAEADAEKPQQQQESAATEQQQQQQDDKEESTAVTVQPNPDVWRCECCRKDFKSYGQWKNHLNSKKHKKTQKRFNERKQKEVAAAAAAKAVAMAAAKAAKFTAAADKESGSAPNDDDETTSTTAAVRIVKKWKGTKEQRERKRHKMILRDLINKDKQERRANGGKLKTKLGVDGYRPTGTLYESDG